MKTTLQYKSPSGYINIEKFVPPFQSVHSGYGFVGLLAVDTGTGKLQCHFCGNWYEYLSSHVSQTHGLTPDEYKKEFQLLPRTAMKTIRLREEASVRMAHMRKDRPSVFASKNQFRKGNKYNGNPTGNEFRTEYKNRRGTCELQVATKIWELKKKLGRLPRFSELRNAYGAKFIALLDYRYDGYKNLYKKLNLHG